MVSGGWCQLSEAVEDQTHHQDYAWQRGMVIEKSCFEMKSANSFALQPCYLKSRQRCRYGSEKLIWIAQRVMVIVDGKLRRIVELSSL